MNENVAQEILHELFSSLETLDTQNAAILQLLREKGMASEEELASCMERAGDMASVRWRAVRVRVDYLLSSAMKAEEEAAERKKKESPKNAENTEKTEGDATQSRDVETEAEAKSETQSETKSNTKTKAQTPETKETGDDAGGGKKGAADKKGESSAAASSVQKNPNPEDKDKDKAGKPESQTAA